MDINQLLKIFCVLLFAVVITACKTKKNSITSTVETASTGNDITRNDIRKWIIDKGFKSMLVYRRSTDANFIEIEQIGDHSSIAKLRQYIKPRSLEIYLEDERVEGVIAMLAYADSSKDVSINTYICSVVSGKVSLFSHNNELVVSSSELLDVMREQFNHEGTDKQSPPSDNSPLEDEAE